MNRSSEDLEERLTRLERQNRHFRAVMAVVLALNLVPLVTTTAGEQATVVTRRAGPETTEVVRTRRIEIVRGETVVAFVDSTEAGGRLHVRDAAGQPVASVAAANEGRSVYGQLCLSTPASTCALLARAVAGNSGQLHLYSAKAHTASLTADVTGGSLQLWDAVRMTARPPIDLAAGAYMMTVNGFRGSAQLGDLGLLLLDKDGNRRSGR